MSHYNSFSTTVALNKVTNLVTVCMTVTAVQCVSL